MPALIDRAADVRLVKAALRRSRVVALLGPRQCGKTTLARLLVRPQSLNYFDREDPQSLARLEEPATTLRPLKGLVVIDEVQRCHYCRTEHEVQLGSGMDTGVSGRGSGRDHSKL